jgi:hypothetical protein
MNYLQYCQIFKLTVASTSETLLGYSGDEKSTSSAHFALTCQTIAGIRIGSFEGERYEPTADGVKLASVLKMVPRLLSHRISAMKPAPTSKTLPEASGPSGWQRAATNGATKSG